MLLPRNLNAFYISLIDWAQLTGHPKRLSNPKPNFAMVVGCGLLVVGYRLWVIGCGLLVRMQIDSPVYLTILPKTNNRQPKTNNQKPTNHKLLFHKHTAWTVFVRIDERFIFINTHL